MITNPSGPAPTFVQLVDVTNPGIVFTSPYTTITFDFDRALGHQLSAGSTFATYLPLFGLSVAGGSFEILQAAAVPEPSALVLASIATGLALGIVWWRIRTVRGARSTFDPLPTAAVPPAH
jgi:hypothetical protein